MKINTVNLENVKDRYRRQEREELLKIYPNERLMNKYILLVQSELWLPYISEKISGIVEFLYEDGEEVKTYKTKLRNPYPNKMYTVLSRVNGNKVCKLGIPVVFNSFTEISKLIAVVIMWEIDLINNNNKLEKYYIHVVYNVHFKYEPNTNVYSIHSVDTILRSCEENYTDKRSNYLQEFDTVLFISRKDSRDFFVEYIKGGEEEEKFEDFLMVTEYLQIEKFLQKDINDTKVFISSYYADVTLEPDLIARDCTH